MTARAAHAVVVVLAATAAGCPSPRPPVTADHALGNGNGSGSGDGAVRVTPEHARGPAPKPSASATTLASGVIYETTRAGSGTQHPVGNDRVTVRYRSWSDEGSVSEQNAYVGELFRLPFGIADAVPRMAVGEQARLWVPAVDSHGADTEPLLLELELATIQVAPKVPEDVAEPPRSAHVSKTGIASRVLTAGSGATPNEGDEVVVSFTGWDPDGTMVETTEWDASPRTSNVSWFPAGIQQALGEMSPGGTSRFWIPRKLTGFNDGTDETRLTYDIELLELHPRRPAPTTPKDVAKPPRSAKRTSKGVRYKFLTRAKARKPRPGPHAKVKVHYSGWTTDGAIFDSSLNRGEPAVFPLDGVIAGWTDVLQVMAPGDAIRAWIPESLAYKGQAGRPAGMLVFDIELLEIVP